jgi:hypothetical protein
MARIARRGGGGGALLGLAVLACARAAALATRRPELPPGTAARNCRPEQLPPGTAARNCRDLVCAVPARSVICAIAHNRSLSLTHCFVCTLVPTTGRSHKRGFARLSAACHDRSDASHLSWPPANPRPAPSAPQPRLVVRPGAPRVSSPVDSTCYYTDSSSIYGAVFSCYNNNEGGTAVQRVPMRPPRLGTAAPPPEPPPVRWRPLRRLRKF